LKAFDPGLSTTVIAGYYAGVISSVATNEVYVTEFAIWELFDRERPTWTFKLAA
jgi:hypothetical protein